MFGRSDRNKDLADIRSDLIKRLFAVAISVGFASSIARLSWVEQAELPPASFWYGQGLVLFTAMFTTLLSWDGYFLSIKSKPLYSALRFYIDIVLVFMYMIMLMTSKIQHLWMYILCLIFLLYVAWDILTIGEHLDKYDSEKPETAPHASFYDIPRIYLGGFVDAERIGRGPITTLVWGSFFAFLALMNWIYGSGSDWAMCGFAILGLYLYRRDKRYRSVDLIKGFSNLHRLAVVITLGLSVAIYFEWANVERVIGIDKINWFASGLEIINFAPNA